MAIKKEDFDKPLDETLVDYLKRFSTTEDMFSVAKEKGLRKSSLHTLIYRGAKLSPYHSAALTALIRKAHDRIESDYTHYKIVKNTFKNYL